MRTRLTSPRDRAWRASAAALTLPAAILTFTTTRQPPPPTAIPVQRINLNTAPAAHLQLLPRIGPTLASAIIADRTENGPFQTLEDLDRVPRIGPRTLIKIAPDAAFSTHLP